MAAIIDRETNVRGVWVSDATGNPAGTAANPLIVSGGGSGGTADQVQGNIAHDAADSGSPVKIGGYGSTAVPTAVGAGDRVNAWYTLNGAAVSMLVDTITGNPVYASGLNATSLSSANPGLWTNSRAFVWDGANAIAARGDTVSAFARAAPRAKTDSAVTAGSTTSQQLFAANAVRSKLIIQNQDLAINVFINLGATAVAGAGNVRIAPGATLELTGTNQAVNLIAASGTPAICAWEM